MGIHYDYKSFRSAKLMEKKAKRERKLAEKRARKNSKSEIVSKDKENKTIDINTTITLDMLTDPNKK